jgi:hypothetical protein
MTTVVVEYKHDPPITDEALADFVARLRKCSEVREVVWVRTYLSFDRATMFAVFEADNAELVRMAHGMSGTTYARLYPMTVV